MEKKRWIEITVAIVIIAVAILLLRLPDLSARPMHGDEANQAVKTGILLETGKYVYDPHDHHGPTLYYAAAIVAKLRGQHTLAETDEFTFRIVPVIFGVATIAAISLATRGLGTGAVWLTMLLLAVSPAFSYYNRYFIQETMLVFFTWTFLACGYRYFAKPGIGWAIGIGLSAGLMHATKETCVLAFAATGAGLVGLAVTHREAAKTWWSERPKSIWIHAAIAGAAGLVVSVVLFTAFFTHLRGPLDSILTYGNYLKRAEGAGMHDKPWYYYFEVLGYYKRGLGAPWSEWPILVLATTGLAVAWLRRGENQTFIRFLSLFTLALMTAYCIIPYKTPWSMLSFYLGFSVLAGFALGTAYERVRVNRLAIIGLAIVATLLIAPVYAQAKRANFDFPADPRNPYVYAHTSSSFLKLADQMNALHELHEDPDAFTLYALDPEGDYWPIPWYARGIERAGYFSAPPERYDADMIIASTKVSRGVYEHIKDTHAGPMTHSLRPGVLLHVFVENGLWQRYLASQE